MNKTEKEKIAQKMVTVSSTTLQLVEMSFEEYADPAYLRPFYILLSYIFEIILKSRLVIISKFANRQILRKYLKSLGHNI
ncbi:MAG: hypothetical protein Q8P97_02320, partial [bacterium]|nr:hypothetical protein [bacterium]